MKVVYANAYVESREKQIGENVLRSVYVVMYSLSNTPLPSRTLKGQTERCLCSAL